MYFKIYSPFNSPAINGLERKREGKTISLLVFFFFFFLLFQEPKLYEDLIGIQRMINVKIW